MGLMPGALRVITLHTHPISQVIGHNSLRGKHLVSADNARKSKAKTEAGLTIELRLYPQLLQINTGTFLYILYRCRCDFHTWFQILTWQNNP